MSSTRRDVWIHGKDGTCNQWGCSTNWRHGAGEESVSYGIGGRLIDSSRLQVYKSRVTGGPVVTGDTQVKLLTVDDRSRPRLRRKLPVTRYVLQVASYSRPSLRRKCRSGSVVHASLTTRFQPRLSCTPH